MATLPTEIWNRVLLHLQHTDTLLPDWEPWLTYRAVNRHFKEIVERQYVQRYLRPSAVVLTPHGSLVWPKAGGRPNAWYEFVGFIGMGDRLALFRRNSGKSERAEGANPGKEIHESRFVSPRDGYDPAILMRIGTGATDLLPDDLQFCPSEAVPGYTGSFVFDWRNYFGNLFTEIRQRVPVVEAHILKKRENDLSLDVHGDMRDQVVNLIQLATSLYKKDREAQDSPPVRSVNLISMNEEFASSRTEDEDDHLHLSPHARAQLILAAGTFDIGCDGRYREFRRQRRRRIWLKQKLREGKATDLNEENETGEEREQRMAFERCDEGHLARRLLMLQVSMETGTELEW